MPPQNNSIEGYVVPISGNSTIHVDLKTMTYVVGYETKRGFIPIKDFNVRKEFGGDKMIHRYDSNK